MFSLFRKLVKPKPKPIISLTSECKSYGLCSSMHQLPNGLILSIGGYHPFDKEKQHQTEALLFDLPLNTKMAETVLPVRYKAISNVTDDNKLLLWERNNIAVVNCNTLQLVDNISIDFGKFDDWFSLGDQKFVTIETPDYDNPDAPFRLLIQDLKSKQFNQPASLPLPINEHAAVRAGSRNCITVNHFSQLPNGQFACLVRGYNTNYFSVIVFDRTPGAKHEFKVNRVIEPAPEKYNWISTNSTPSAYYAGLPNGDILTYRIAGQNFQVWRGIECIDTWSWHKDVRCNDEVFNRGFWTHKVLPLLDGEHLLIDTHTQLFLFNMKTREMQAVDLGKFEITDVSLCSDGKVMVRGTKQFEPYRENNTLLVVDFGEMLAKTANVNFENRV